MTTTVSTSRVVIGAAGVLTRGGLAAGGLATRGASGIGVGDVTTAVETEADDARSIGPAKLAITGTAKSATTDGEGAGLRSTSEIGFFVTSSIRGLSAGTFDTVVTSIGARRDAISADLDTRGGNCAVIGTGFTSNTAPVNVTIIAIDAPAANQKSGIAARGDTVSVISSTFICLRLVRRSYVNNNDLWLTSDYQDLTHFLSQIHD